MGSESPMTELNLGYLARYLAGMCLHALLGVFLGLCHRTGSAFVWVQSPVGEMCATRLLLPRTVPPTSSRVWSCLIAEFCSRIDR